MALTTGTRLGLYEITALVGAGGMGEVYEGRDTGLDRRVAIKVLPEIFADDPERLARFEREARTLAALNHPNIAQIYGFERADRVRALVMELVEGPTLDARIAEGPVPLDEALPIARQVADALEAAHEQGIVHRDLKPANIKLRPDGTVKVLDFGLAKALEPFAAGSGASSSPTITSPAMMTRVGVLLGTAAYMSPEQARGKPVDRRADTWAFGCVLFEMLTGRRAFDGEDVSVTISQILQRDPPLDALPADLPANVRQVVELCLRRPLKQRMPDIGTARLMLEGAFDATITRQPGSDATGHRGWRSTIPLLLIAAGAAIIGAIAVWQMMPARVANPRNVVRFALPLPQSVAPRGAGLGRHAFAISPQGTHLLYWADDKLHLRALDSLDEAGTIRGTEGAREPFFSPDGQWIGFQQQGQLKRMPVGGGAPIALGGVRNPWGASWDADGVIRYGQGLEGIWQVSPTGSPPAQVIGVGAGEYAHGPQLLPDGKSVLFTLRPASQDSWDEAQVVAQSLATGERVVLIDRGRDARYIATGHLIYGANGVLLGVPFDVRALRVTGPAVPLVEGVMDADVRTGAMHFTVSNDGTLVYLSGESGARSILTWVQPDGRRERLSADPRTYGSARVSPDGTRVAVEVAERDGVQIHIYDLARKALTRLISSPSNGGRYPLWTPDSQRVVFYADAGGGGLYSMAANGTGSPTRLTTSRALQIPYSWAEGGRKLIIEQRAPDRLGSAAIYMLSLAGEPTAMPLLTTAAHETQPALSPDGRWLAYTAREPGNQDVYVRPFPDVESGRWRISTDGDGHSPIWSHDGKRLFFISRGRAISVSIESSPALRLKTPTAMFDMPPFYSSTSGSMGRQWDIAPDDARFLIMNPGEAAAGEDSLSRIVVVLNWTEELKRRVPRH